MVQSVRQSNMLRAQDWESIYRAFADVNFNAYDFDTIRTSMVNYLRLNFPEDFNDWTERSEFVMIIDLLAYLGELLAFRMDVNARENFIDTAERRESILKLARMLSYEPSRNLAATGFVKITSVSTNDDVFDSNGNNLNGIDINWNDSNNPNWYEQWQIVMNQALIQSNPFGVPVKEGQTANQNFQIYRLNNAPENAGIYTFNAQVNARSLPFNIVPIDYDPVENRLFEPAPNPLAQFQLLYRNDSQGFSSPRTGFFFYIKQGNISFNDFNITVSLENRVLPIDRENTNNSDIWVQEIREDGTVRRNWTKLPSVVGNNVIYNALQNNERYIYSVATRENDQFAIRFSDGDFGRIPTGLIRVWSRQSDNSTFTVRKEDIRNLRQRIPYFNRNGIRRNITFTYRLEENIANSSRAESFLNIRQNAPRVYYTQNRMVNGEDYNVQALSSPLVIKARAVNRTYSGHSRFIDINDPTSNYQNANVFAEDGILYRNFDNNRRELRKSELTNLEIVNRNIQSLMKEAEFKDFMLTEWKRQWQNANPDWQPTIPYLRWQQKNQAIYSSSGRLIDNNGSSVNINREPALVWTDLIRIGTMLKFKNAGWVTVKNVFREGTRDLPSGEGPIRLNEDVNDDDEVIDWIPPINLTLPSEKKSEIITLIENNNDFSLTYDWVNTEWKINRGLPGGFPNGEWKINTKTDWLVRMLKNNIAGSNSYELTTRGIQYVFESEKEVRFFFEGDEVKFDNNTGRRVRDYIDILSVNPTPGDGQTGIGDNNKLSMVGNFIYQDGFIENRRIKVTFFDEDLDGSPDNPDFFERIVLNNSDGTEIPLLDQYVFWKKEIDSLGYEIFVPTRVDKIFNTLSELDDDYRMNPQEWKDEIFAHAFDENIYLKFNVEDEVKPTPENPNPPDLGLPKPPSQQEILNSANWRRHLGRNNLKFQWKHFANNEIRIDPSRSNLIDIYVLTNQYNTELRRWLNNNGTLDTMPSPPSAQDLRIAFQEFDEIKMISDQIIWKPVKYKLILGSRSAEELQAKFRVVKLTSTRQSNSEIKALLINAVNDFFNVFNWDFGGTFSGSELCSYIHRRMATIISSCVIVPLNEESGFGNLYEITAAPDELLISSATTDDVEIVERLTETNLRIKS